MSNRKAVHPPGVPEPPYFRGVDFLDGGVGDLLYGTYGRSTNTMVVDATSLSKRNGYLRAFDEKFHGNAVAHRYQERTFNYSVATDADGVKVLQSFAPKINGGDRFGSVAYPVDTFDRADSATLYSTEDKKYWIEGAVASGGTSFDTDLKIASNQVKLDTKGQEGTADMGFNLPSPYFVWRFELDLTGLDPDDTGSGGPDSRHSLFLSFMTGLPMDHIQDGVVLQRWWPVGDALAVDSTTKYNPDTGSSAHTEDAPWMGLRWDLEINSSRRLEITQWQYASNYRTTEKPGEARLGKKILADRTFHTFGSDADMQKKHYFELVRVRRGDRVLQTYRFYENATKLTAPLKTPTVSGTDIMLTVDGELGNHPGWYQVVSEPSGRYGHVGMFGRLGVAGSSFGLDNMDCAVDVL